MAISLSREAIFNLLVGGASLGTGLAVTALCSCWAVALWRRIRAERGGEPPEAGHQHTANLPPEPTGVITERMLMGHL